MAAAIRSCVTSVSACELHSTQPASDSASFKSVRSCFRSRTPCGRGERRTYSRNLLGGNPSRGVRLREVAISNRSAITLRIDAGLSVSWRVSKWSARRRARRWDVGLDNRVENSAPGYSTPAGWT